MSIKRSKKSRVRIYTEGKMNRRSNCEIEMASLLPFLPKSIQKDYAENKNLEFSFICTGKAKTICQDHPLQDRLGRVLMFRQIGKAKYGTNQLIRACFVRFLPISNHIHR